MENTNQNRANNLIAAGHNFSLATMQCLTFIALCPFNAKDTPLLDKIEREALQAKGIAPSTIGANWGDVR